MLVMELILAVFLCYGDSNFNQDIGDWDVSNGTTLTQCLRAQHSLIAI